MEVTSIHGVRKIGRGRGRFRVRCINKIMEEEC